MAAPPSLRHQQRLQLMAVNRALHQQQLSIKMMNALQRQRQQQHLKSTQHYTRNIHLMGAPKAPRQPSSPNPFAGFVPTPFQFTPFQFTPFQFTPFQFTPFQFTPFKPFKFQPFPKHQKPPAIIGKIGKFFAKLPFKSLKLLKLLKPFKAILPKGHNRRNHRLLRNRRGMGPFRGRGLLGIAALSAPRRKRGIRIPMTGFRVRLGRGRGRGQGRHRGSPNRRRRVTSKRPATMRQRLERQRWGKAGVRAARRHQRRRF